MTPQESTGGAIPLKVYYVDGVPAQASARYRVFNALEQLRQAGVEGVLLPPDYDPEAALPGSDGRRSILVLHRAPWDERLEALIEAAREQGARVIYDIDDLVFDPLVLPWVRALARLNESELELYEDGVRRYHRALKACDGVLTTTRALAKVVAAEGIPAFIHRNGLDARSLDTAQAAGKLRRARDETVLYYGAGTATHDVDFQECAAALERLLQKHPSLNLLVQGDVELEPSIDKFGARIRRWPWMPWPDYFWGIAQGDVNIAPVELGNPFCNVKSELKWFEAATMGVPTVASATDAFGEVIRQGENGFVARTSEEWFEILDELIRDPARREAIGATAEAEVTTRYEPASMGKSLSGLLSQIASAEILTELAEELGDSAVSPGGMSAPRDTVAADRPAPDRPRLTLGFLATAPVRGGGGSRIIMQLARHMKAFGHDVTLYVEPLGHFRNEKEMESFLARNFPGDSVPVVMGMENARQSDALIASFWLTAQALREMKQTRGKFYLVQDFEPYFYSMGEEYLRAEETYRFGFHHISIGPWCAKFLREHYEARADHFDFPLDRRIYYERPVVRGGPQPRVIFFARPEMPRRCYTLGIDALARLKARRADVKITLFGSDEIDARTLPFACENLKNVSDRNKLAELYSSADAALILSATNTSLVPYEVAACGCPVVDLDIDINRVNYKGSEAVVLAGADPEALADALCRIIEDPDVRDAHRTAGLRLAESMPTEEQSARRFEDILFQGLGIMPPPPATGAPASGNGHAGTLDGLLLDITCRSEDDDTVEIKPGREIAQTFVCNFSNLAGVAVKVANLSERVKDPCALEVAISEDGSPEPIQRIGQSLVGIGDNSWLTFRFPAIPNSAGKNYRLTFSSPDARAGNAVPLRQAKKTPYKHGRLSQNGRADRGALVFQTFVARDDERMRSLLRPGQAIPYRPYGSAAFTGGAEPSGARSAASNGYLAQDDLRAMRRRLERMEQRQNDVMLRVTEMHNLVSALRRSLPYRAARKVSRTFRRR